MLSFPHIAYLIPLLPFFGFLVNGLGRKHLSHGAVAWIASGVMALAFAASLFVFWNIPAGNPTILTAFDFIRIGDGSLFFCCVACFVVVFSRISCILNKYFATFRFFKA